MESVSVAASLGTQFTRAEIIASPTTQFCTDGCNPGYIGFSVTKLYKLPMLQSGLPSVRTVYPRVNPMGVSMGVWMGFMDWNVTFDVIAPTGLPVNRKLGTVWPKEITPFRPISPYGTMRTTLWWRHHKQRHISIHVCNFYLLF